MKIALIFALKATKSTSNYPLNITSSTHIRKFHQKIIKNNNNNTKTPEVKLVAKIKEISSLITKKNFKNISKMFLFGCREKKPKLKISEFQLLQTNQSPPQVFNSAETAFPKPLSSSPFPRVSQQPNRPRSTNQSRHQSKIKGVPYGNRTGRKRE